MNIFPFHKASHYSIHLINDIMLIGLSEPEIEITKLIDKTFVCEQVKNNSDKKNIRGLYLSDIFRSIVLWSMSRLSLPM